LSGIPTCSVKIFEEIIKIMNSILQITELNLNNNLFLELGYIGSCWVWEMNMAGFAFISCRSPTIPPGIPYWELETRFDFSLYNEHMAGEQIASKLFDLH
jgi:hypothetical protein